MLKGPSDVDVENPINHLEGHIQTEVKNVNLFGEGAQLEILWGKPLAEG